MIDKRLHFIWLGDNVPDYYGHALTAYGEMNPSYEINRVLYTKDKIECLSGEELENVENP